MLEITKLKNEIVNMLKNKKESIKLKNIVVDIVNDDKDEYYLILEKEKYLASLVIAEPIFAPYKNVSFEIYRVSDEKIILFYYDNENTTLQQNIKKINTILDNFIDMD